MAITSAPWLPRASCSRASARDASESGSSKPPWEREPKTPAPYAPAAMASARPASSTASGRRTRKPLQRSSIRLTPFSKVNGVNGKQCKLFASRGCGGSEVAEPAMTRRERQREATYEEIVTAARDLLAAGEELS